MFPAYPSPPSRSGSTAAVRVALFILAAGAISVVLAAAQYKTFDLDRYFVPKELVLHLSAASVALLCVFRCRRFSISIVDLLLFAFLLSGLVSAAFALNGWAAQRSWAISFSGAVLFWTASVLRRAGLVRPLLIGLAASVVVGASTALAQAYGVDTEFFSLNRAPGGTFGNRNFVAHLAAMGTPVVVLVALTARRGFGSVFGGIAMAVVAAALVLSRSRAAWLAVIALAVPAAGLAFLTRSRWREPRTVRRLLVLGAATAVGAIAAVFLPNNLEWKSDSPYLDSAAGIVNYKEGSGRGRLVQYSNSVRMTRAHPMFGVGPGNWAVVYPKYASRNDPSMSQSDGVTANPWPSSDWFAFLTERGAVGFALLLLVMLGLFGRAVKELRVGGGHDAERVLTAIALIATLTATAVVGAFDAVLVLAAPAFFFWTAAGVLTPPFQGSIEWDRGARFGPLIALGIAGISFIRSGAQLVAMGTYDQSTRLGNVAQAATFDPGSYRIQMRLAQGYLARGDCARAKTAARSARELFPNAGEPRRILASCGSR
jgi:O-antigen ligase